MSEKPVRRALEDLPTISLASKLGSIVVHVEEGIGPGAHPFDLVALDSLVNDPEVQWWLASLPAALLPVKRGKATRKVGGGT